MAGFGSAASRLAQVQGWVTERATSLGVAISVELLCSIAVSRLGVSGAVLIMENAQGWPETRHSTDALGAGLAELEITVGEGPCVDAHRTGGPVLVADLDSPAGQRRWPLFAPLAVEAGARAVFALPLCVGAIQAGVLMLHDGEPRRLEQETLTASSAFAALALRLLLDEHAALRTRDGDQADALPLHSPQVHQATGMISAQLGISMDEAFVRLRARAFSDQRHLADLAADVVARRLWFDHTGEGT